MPVQELERDYLSTPTNSAEIQALQDPDNVIFFNSSKRVELSERLRVDLELQKAGWNSGMEIKRFVDDINAELAKGLTLEEAVSRSTEVFEYHIRYYDAEFIKQEPVLLHLNRFGFWSGEVRLLGNNGRPVVDAVDSRERVGSVKRASKKIEEDLLNAGNNSFVVLMSPQGESGYPDENGRDIPHLNTQTMVFRKDEHGNSKGITLITDLTIDQAGKVMADLGAPTNFFAKRGTEMQRITNILENPAKPSLPEMYKNPFQYVFDKILAVRGSGDICLRQKNGGAEVKSVTEIRQKINKFQSLLDLSLTKEKCLEEFRRFILDHFQKVGDPDFQQAIIEMAEETVLLFARDYMNKKSNQPVSHLLVFPQYTENAGRITIVCPPDRDFRREIAFLQTRAGCPSAVKALGGGSGSIVGGSGFGESDSMGSLFFSCPVCGTTNKRPREGYVNNCQSCGSDKVSCNSSGTTTDQQKGDSKVISFPGSTSRELAKAA